MFFRLLFLLTAVPVAEIYILIKLSDEIGWDGTLLFVIITGILGAQLLRRQGTSILMEIQKGSGQGHLPSEALIKGFFTFIGGLLLLTPGVLTDVLGLSLVFPPTQILWKAYFHRVWQSGLARGSVQVFTSQGRPHKQDPWSDSGASGKSSPRFDSEVIDVEVISSKTTRNNQEE